MQGVALQPLAPVEEPAQLADLRVEGHAEKPFEALDGGHLVGHRADAADAGHHVQDLVGMTAHHEPLEEAGCLEDRELGAHDLVAADDDAKATLALDTRHGIDGERALGPDLGRSGGGRAAHGASSATGGAGAAVRGDGAGARMPGGPPAASMIWRISGRPRGEARELRRDPLLG